MSGTSTSAEAWDVVLDLWSDPELLLPPREVLPEGRLISGWWLSGAGVLWLAIVFFDVVVEHAFRGG